MGVGRAQHFCSGGLHASLEAFSVKVEPATGQGRPDRTERPGFFLLEFKCKFRN
jgi:hypothetical protein